MHARGEVNMADSLNVIVYNFVSRCQMASNIVQYVVVRGDLLRTMNWPTGAIIAQACHACTAVTHLFYDDEHTKSYLADLDRMHKVVLEVS